MSLVFLWDILSSSVYSHLKISALLLFECKEPLQFQQEDVLNNSKAIFKKKMFNCCSTKQTTYKIHEKEEVFLLCVVGPGIRTGRAEVWLGLQLYLRSVTTELWWQNVLIFYITKMEQVFYKI